jgi:hypothetical protein
MKMCMPHWTALRAAIDARGLAALVADNGEKAAANVASELADGQTIDNFDPLMGAHNAILSNALDAAGAVILFAAPDGSDVCPLCYLNDRARYVWDAGVAYGMKPGDKCRCADPTCTATFPAQPDTYDGWIDRAADDQVDAWKALRP